MTPVIFTVLACGLLLLFGATAYQYLVHRNDESCGIKSFFQPQYEYLPLLIMVAGFLSSVLVFVLNFFWQNNVFMRAFMNASVMLWLSLVGYIDARERIIPNALIIVGLAFWLLLTLIDIFVGGTPWLQLLVFSGIGGIACGGLLFVIALIAKSALGMGDVKLFFVLGLLYGLTDAYGVLIFSIITMGIISIILLIAKKVTRKSTIPMAPFVIIGFFLSILAGM